MLDLHIVWYRKKEHDMLPVVQLFSERIVKLHLSFINMIKTKHSLEVWRMQYYSIGTKMNMGLGKTVCVMCPIGLWQTKHPPKNYEHHNYKCYINRFHLYILNFNADFRLLSITQSLLFTVRWQGADYCGKCKGLKKRENEKDTDRYLVNHLS